MNRIERSLGILLLLRGGNRLSATELAERFEVSTRTIYRDVDALGELGVPVIAETGRNGGFRLQEGYFLPPVMFSLGEAVSLLLGASMLRGLRVRPFAAELDSGEEKLVAAMPPSLRTVLADARSVIGFEGVAGDAFHSPAPEMWPAGERDATSEGHVVEVFLQAVLNRRTVALRYRSPYRPENSSRVVSPLGVIADRDLWYLVGRRFGEVGEPRLWRADRVLEIRAQTRQAESDPSFDVRRLLDRTWLGAAMADWEREAPVTIRLGEAQVRRLRRDWYYGHATFARSADGRFEMMFGQDDPSVVIELVRWLGPGAELVEPAAWRSNLREELVEMLAAHEGEAQPVTTDRLAGPSPSATVGRRRPG
jgi:predicted DNA-binding transcriptional regulator YafY